MLLRTRKRTNPLFYREQLSTLLGPDRAERARTDPSSVDLLVWNVFASLDRHPDHAWAGQRFAMLGGDAVRAPWRLSLWTGADREPLLTPSAPYLDEIRSRMRRASGTDADVAGFAVPVEVPVRIDTPDVVVLVDAVLHQSARGRGGGDRIVDLVDAAVEQARRVGKQAAVAVVHAAGSPAADEVSARVRALSEPGGLLREVPNRGELPPVILRQISWQQVLRMWQEEADHLPLGGQPVRGFVDHCRGLGLL